MTMAYTGHGPVQDFGLGDVCADCGITRAEAFRAPSEPYVSPHKNLDPITGCCADCGATSEQIDDRIFETCTPVTGPHREAILALRRERRQVVFMIEEARRESIMAESRAVEADRKRRNLEARLAQLERSSAMLEIAEVTSLTLTAEGLEALRRGAPKTPFGGMLPE